jgi:ATP-dependent DNA ligase
MGLDEVVPMKAHPAEMAELERWIADDRWAMEPKADGIRALVRIVDGVAVAIGTMKQVLGDQGAAQLLSQPAYAGEWAIDGEWLDGVFWAFDLPLSPVTTPATPFADRRRALEMLGRTAGWDDETPVRVIPQATTPEAKRQMWEDTVALGTEGVMLKDRQARYEAGKRSWTTRKVKHVRTVDAVVTSWHPVKASITLALWCDGMLREVGACSWDDPRPPVDSVVEVRCLYLGERGRLYQPIGVRERPDKQGEECTWEQLRGLSPNRQIVRAR